MATPADAFKNPNELSGSNLHWLEIEQPSTAAACLRAVGQWSLDVSPRRFDAEDWWYKIGFSKPLLAEHELLFLGFDGLATVAEVWFNGAALFSSDNMFIAHQHRIDHLLKDDNELAIRCRSLDHLLKARRPRPRWRAPMIENQQLRWFRTTLLGRTPGWSPPAAAVGPWRGVWLEKSSGVEIQEIHLSATVRSGTGHVSASCRVLAADGETAADGEIASVELLLERNGHTHRATLQRGAGTDFYAGELRADDAELWWPHTHGEPALYRASLAVRPAGNDAQVTRSPAGAIGFRTISVDTSNGNFSVSINGARIFCRGACWTPLDPVSLSATPAAYAEAIGQVRAAGMNMLRVGGTMVYENNEFLDLCDANGILLWQDFMFANMDYPEGDPTFMASITTEVTQQLSRLSHRPCLTVLCGNSEVEQQAAMWGAAREYWSPKLFHEYLRKLSAQHCPHVPYWPSSAHGGAFPHQVNAGTASYYGVGAYLRGLHDARLADVRFATECLAFANVPEAAGLASMPGGLDTKVHSPQWKIRAPRDLGAGWDFDDVRDHYLSLIFGVEPLGLRYSDHDRYLILSRVVCGEVMAATFKEWRRKSSRCAGGLVWFLRDLWMGAGWGSIDSAGVPKASYYYLRRALQPLSLFVTDEGCNGLAMHVINEGPRPCHATLTIALYRDSIAVGKPARQVLAILPGESLELSEAEIRDEFSDVNHAYRFGAPVADLLVARFEDTAGNILAKEFFHLPTRTLRGETDIGLSVEAHACGEQDVQLKIHTRRYADTIWIEADGVRMEDNYFHLEPDATRTIMLEKRIPGSPARGIIRALNMSGAVRFAVSG